MWKKPLASLAVVLALEAVVAVSVIAGTFIGLHNDRALLVLGMPISVSLGELLRLATLRLTIFVGGMALVALLSAVGAWEIYRATRKKQLGHSRRWMLTVALTAQPVALVASVLTLILDTSSTGFDSSFWSGASWASFSLVATGILSLGATVLALRSLRLRLLRPKWAVSFVTAFIVTTVAFFATNAIMSEPFSSVGFWQPGPLVNTGLFDDIDGLSCPTVGACAVVAVTVPTEDWSIGSISNDRIVASEALRSSNPANITCATQLVCLAMDRNVPVRSTDRGRTFDGMKIASEPGMSFRCDSPKRCYAFAPALMSVSTDEGLHWKTLLALPTSENGTTIYSGACPTVSDCTVVGRKVGGPIASYTLTGGRSWLPASGVAGFDQLSSVRCVTDLTCYALATNASGLLSVVTTNAGKHWSSLSKIPQIESMSGFACPEALTCVASGGTLGSDSVVEVTTSGGKAWRTSLAVSSNAQLGPLGCNHQGMCAVGLSYIFSRQRPGIETSTNYGQSWTVVPFPRVPVTK